MIDLKDERAGLTSQLQADRSEVSSNYWVKVEEEDGQRAGL